MARIVILGAGTAGTILANRLDRLYADEMARGLTTIAVVDEDDRHLYQPGLLFIPFGLYQPQQVVRPKRPLLRRGVRYVRGTVDRVVMEARFVFLCGGVL